MTITAADIADKILEHFSIQNEEYRNILVDAITSAKPDSFQVAKEFQFMRVHGYIGSVLLWAGIYIKQRVLLIINAAFIDSSEKILLHTIDNGTIEVEMCKLTTAMLSNIISVIDNSSDKIDLRTAALKFDMRFVESNTGKLYRLQSSDKVLEYIHKHKMDNTIYDIYNEMAHSKIDTSSIIGRGLPYIYGCTYHTLIANIIEKSTSMRKLLAIKDSTDINSVDSIEIVREISRVVRKVDLSHVDIDKVHKAKRIINDDHLRAIELDLYMYCSDTKLTAKEAAYSSFKDYDEYFRDLDYLVVARESYVLKCDELTIGDAIWAYISSLIRKDEEQAC